MKPDTADQIHDAGHRDFVGGDGPYWDSISTLTFDYLTANELKPHHRLLDIACGSLRSGVRFINYLDPGRYVGVDKHIELIIYGVAAELGLETYRAKRPRFVVSDDFAFERTGAQPDFALAQSLFTHLTEADIRKCLERLGAVAAAGCTFFATYFEAGTEHANPAASHSHGLFSYTREQMERFGSDTGWAADHRGAWNHPRNQQMIVYRR